MIYDIRLRIAHVYASPATGGRHIVCVAPLDLPGVQRVIADLLDIAPAPMERLDRRDFFGNRVVEFALRDPHDGIAVTLKSRVDRLDDAPAPASAIRLSDMADTLLRRTDVGPASPLHFTAASARVPQNAAMTRFARSVTSPDMDAVQALHAVGNALHAHMRFDATATTVTTPAAEAFSRRSGVCQDFSHIMIACLRGIGMPAGYVSGYLRTVPPPGQPRLEGADAMHAWVQAWCGPGAGWLSFDPTNATVAGPGHIVVARGRDYADVAPVRGILRSAGPQKSSQSVDVVALWSAP